MRITTKAEYIWSDKQNCYLILSKKSINWTGVVALCKGATGDQTNLAANLQSFYNTLSTDYGQQFANQNSILSSLNNTLNPIIKAGPNQFGFSTGQTNTLNSQAIQGTGQQYANASKALRESQAAQGGGNTLLPSGVQSQQQSQLASASANQASSELLGIQNAGYQQGNQNFNNAVSGELGISSQYNPLGYAGSATSAGSAAGSELNTIQQENAAASPWGAIGGILGGIGGAALGMPGLGASIGSSIGNGASGANNGDAVNLNPLTNEGYGSNGAMILGGVG